jgi:hypothetical protein
VLRLPAVLSLRTGHRHRDLLLFSPLISATFTPFITSAYVCVSLRNPKLVLFSPLFLILCFSSLSKKSQQGKTWDNRTETDLRRLTQTYALVASATSKPSDSASDAFSVIPHQ